MAGQGGRAAGRPALRAVVLLPPRAGCCEEKLAGSTDERDRPLLDLAWDYAMDGRRAVRRGRAAAHQRRRPDHRAGGRRLPRPQGGRQSTSCGCWIYSGVYADEVNQAARRKSRLDEQGRTSSEWGWTWPMNRRVLYNRASADPQGRPWSERKALVWWDAEQRRVDRPRRPGLREDQAAGLPAARGRGRAGGAARRRPVHHAGRRQGLAVRARTGCWTARCPRTTSRTSRPVRNAAVRRSRATRPARSTAARTTRRTRRRRRRTARCSRSCSPRRG